VQESLDKSEEALVVDVDNAYNAQGRRIKNLADPQDDQDAVTKHYTDQVLIQAQINADAARASAQAAQVAEINAKSHRDTALTAANTATSAANQAVTEVNNAVNNIRDEGDTQVARTISEGDTQVARVQAEGDTQVARTIHEGNTQVARVQAEGNIQIANAEQQADRAENEADRAENEANRAKTIADNLDIVSDNAGFHNSIYRGKFLGTQVTPEQYARIADGTFEDMYIGDYWTINGTTYLIAAFNYYRNSGDSNFTTNHVTLVPAGNMDSHRMNPTATTEGGYVGSEMYISGLDQAKTKIHADFAGHVVNHRKHLSNAVSNGQASAAAWFDSDVELMNEVMVYGSVVNGKGTYDSYNIGTEKSQLPLFALRPDLLNTRGTWWLRDVCSATAFAHVHSNGYAIVANASNALGVRPAFSISA
jgi:hypothetical protein